MRVCMRQCVCEAGLRDKQSRGAQLAMMLVRFGNRGDGAQGDDCSRGYPPSNSSPKAKELNSLAGVLPPKWHSQLTTVSQRISHMESGNLCSAAR